MVLIPSIYNTNFWKDILKYYILNENVLKVIIGQNWRGLHGVIGATASGSLAEGPPAAQGMLAHAATASVSDGSAVNQLSLTASRALPSSASPPRQPSLPDLRRQGHGEEEPYLRL